MTDPRFSSTPQAGYNPVTTGFGQGATFPEWVKTTAEWLASRWAYGEQVLPQGWDIAKYGSPDPNDTNGVWSPRTILAFSQYATNYKPGMDATIDQAIPYIPPGPNDYIEDPVTTATRIANDQFNRTLNFNYASLDATAKANAAKAFNDAFANQIDIYATQAGIYNADELNKIRRYETDAAIYQTIEQIRSGNLQAAGTLATNLQSILDARTSKAIDLAAAPGDFVRREFAVRALQEPTSTGVPAYQNVDSLKDVISRLIEYQPTAAPTAPTPGIAPVAPTAPTQQIYTPEPTFTGFKPTATDEVAIAAQAAANARTQATTPTADTTQSSGWSQRLKDAYLKQGIPVAARGGTFGNSVKKLIVGDPQSDDKPNPELVEVSGPGPTSIKVTPLKGKNKKETKRVKKFSKGVKKYANGGELELPSYSDETYQNLPSLSYLGGKLSKAAYNTLKTGTTSGAFGSKIPESGSINYGRYLDIQQDPTANAMLAALYASGSRDLASEVARAKARAPFGQAVQTTLIRT